MFCMLENNDWFWQLMVIATVVAIPFVIYVVGKPDLFGADSYYFLDSVCNGTVIKTPILAHIGMSGLNCDISIIKFWLFGLAACSAFALSMIGQLYHKNGWRAGFLVFLIPIFFFNFVKFENDAMALPLIFLAAAFFIRKKELSRWLCIPLLIIAGLIWEGTAIFAVGLALSTGPLWLLALPILALKMPEFINAIIPDMSVAENGIGYTIPLLMVGYLGIFNAKKEYLPQLVFFLIVGLINAKWLIFTVPFLIPGMVEKIENLPWKLKRYVYLLCFVMLVAQGIYITRGIPTATQTQAVKDAIELGNGQIQNDWDFGHWVVFYGGDTNSRFHSSWQRPWHKGIVLTKHYLPYCDLVNDYGDVNIYRCDI